MASRIVILVSALFLWTTAGAAGYYDSAAGLTSTNLRAALHVIIRNHTVIPYSSSSFDTSDALKILDEDPSNTNNVILIYGRRSEPKSNFGIATGWNREHLWPNSYGIDDHHPAYSDLHNLRAEDSDVHSARGNKYFDRSNTNAAYYTFPAHVEAQTCSMDDNSWEPPNEVKGDIARAMIYMDVRYEGDTGTEPDLKLTEGFGAITATTNFMGRLLTLLAWHELDPVDDAERQRNEKVFQLYQHNRNPFVDHPEWVREIFWPRLQATGVEVRNGIVSLSFTSPLEFGNARLQTSYGFPLVWVDLGAGIWREDALHYRVFGQSPSQYFRLRPIQSPLP